MEKLLKSYLEEIKKDVTKLRDFKKILVKHQQFEFASNVRDVELELYPISEQDGKYINEAKNFKTILAITDINVNEKTAFTLFNIAKKFIARNVEFDLKDSAEIKMLAEKLYD